MTSCNDDERLTEDEKRRRAITEWWKWKALRDFIAAKRSTLSKD
jgi:hypothetical protein